jgi:hypothetical protein
MKTVAIIHGWAGGNWLTKTFTEYLKKSDFISTKRPAEADIIFAHSAGCYKIPKEAQAELIILHGPPHWPGKSIISRLAIHKFNDTRLLAKQQGWFYILKKLGWETIYIFVHPTVIFVALSNHRSLGFLEALKDKHVILIRNKNDRFCSPEIDGVIRAYKNIKFVELPGQHDDYYTNPKPYIDLLLKELS